MRIQLSLAAGTHGTPSHVNVQTAMEVDTADPKWVRWFVETITQQAQEGAKRLAAQLAPALSAPETPFVPLADIAPIATGPDRS
jgi:hypothetical protein